MNRDNTTTYIIAEAGVNHNGSLQAALQLVDVAADAGADAVKFQTFTAERVISVHAPKADYQIVMTGAGESQLEMVKKLELGKKDHEALLAHCAKRQIDFLSSPFDVESVAVLDELAVSAFKIPSGEITHAPLLLAAARTHKPVILSTGMSTLADVEQALGVLAFGYTLPLTAVSSRGAFALAYKSHEGQEALRRQVVLLHCTTEYPAPFEMVNLRAMDTLQVAFDLPVGISDHTVGITIPIAAVARGALVVEKHITLSRDMPGPDHRASLEPAELADMVKAIRLTEKALGTGRKIPAEVEGKNKDIARKSLMAACPIRQGEVFTANNLTCKRPGTGISPLLYWDYLGKQAPRDLDTDEML